MSITVKVKITNTRNKEKLIKKILKDRKNRRIEKIDFEEENVTITFSDTKSYGVKNIVKQYSKTKYKDRNEAVRKFLGNKPSYWDSIKWKIIKIIELDDEWLIFFMKN